MSKEVKQARKIIQAAFTKDPDFKQTYIANIAMLLFDNQDKAVGWSLKTVSGCNKMAEEILDLIFSS